MGTLFCVRMVRLFMEHAIWNGVNVYKKDSVVQDMDKSTLQKKEHISARFIAKIRDKLMSMLFVFGYLSNYVEARL